MRGAEELLVALRKAVSRDIAGTDAVAVSYSGGLDSSVVAALASEVSLVKAYSCVTEGSFDARNVERCAEEEHLELAIIRLASRDVKRYVRCAATVLGSNSPVPVAYTVPIIRVIDECHEEVVILGSGADELFGGYAKYALMSDPSGAMARDLQKMREEFAHLCAYASTRSKRLAAPFACDQVVSIASALPLHRKLSAGAGKIVLREVADILSLPSSARPKKAAQYSSGVLKEMQRLAKADGMDLGEWTRNTASKNL